MGQPWGSLRRQWVVQWMGPRQVWIPTWPDSGSLSDAWRGVGSSCRARLCSAGFCAKLLRVEYGFLRGRGIGDVENSKRGVDLGIRCADKVGGMDVHSGY